MPGFIACKLCPELIFVPVDFKKYTYYSDLTRKVFEKYDLNFMAASLDEAYLDISKFCQERDITGGEVAEELRQSVYETTGLTCSAGVAANRLLAKVCSDINKPNGQFVLPNDRMAVMTFISSLPIRKIGGIGKVTEHILKDVFGSKTCEDMLQKSSFICALFSPSSADFFLSVALGLGGTDTPQVRLRKSMSSERTFSATANEAFFYRKLVELAEMLSADMKKEGLCGRTLTLKLKTASFEVRSRAVTLQTYIWSSEDILKHASNLLKAELPLSLRLIGLRMSQFNEDKDGALSDPSQKTLFDFMVPGDDLRKNVEDPMFLGPDRKDNHETHCHEFQDSSNDQISDVGCNNCTLSSSSGVSVEIHGPENNEYNDKDNVQTLVGNTLTSCGSKASELVGADFLLLPRQIEGRSLDQVKIQFSNDEAGSSSNQKDSLIWVDDYKCLLCGVELPPSFVEERQEHSDFHLAERLQEEESGNRLLTLKHRLIQKEPVASQSKGKKKQKQSPSDGKHLSIDMFFAKRTKGL